VLSPVDLYRGWIAVRHTSLGDHGVAWIEARRAPLVYAGRHVRLEVDLSRRELQVFSGDHLRRRLSVAIGAPDTPTPPGEYYVTDKLPGARFGTYYGCCILALSGHQPNLPEGWSGGDRLAIHGSPTPTWGRAVSNGCFHASRRDLRYLMRNVPLGTEVIVHA
jgi:lipoprotein-anchoring transpeptidase ErfK/SrfK